MQCTFDLVIKCLIKTCDITFNQNIYRVFHIDSPKVFAYCSKNMITSDILSLLGAHQLWSI